MNFDFSEEQASLRAALARQLERSYDFEKRKHIVASASGISDKVWQQLAELGALAVSLPEEHGGLGGGAVDTLVVAEQLGRRLVVEPFLPTVVLGAGLLLDGGSAAQRAAHLPAVAAGERYLALAHDEEAARYQLAHVETTARRDGQGFVLDGKKVVALGGGAAHALIVSARTSGEAGDERGITLFLVDAAAEGVTRLAYRTQDSHRAADVTLRGVRVAAEAVLGQVDEGFPLLERGVERAIAAACGEALGIMTEMLEITGSYVKTRKQFGVPIGSFQALQHRLADMLMRVEQVRSMAYLTASTLAAGAAGAVGGDALERRRIFAAAKAVMSQAARFVGQQAIQLHGGIGVTDEAPISHYFKRLTVLELAFGDADHHLGRFSDAMAR